MKMIKKKREKNNVNEAEEYNLNYSERYQTHGEDTDQTILNTSETIFAKLEIQKLLQENYKSTSDSFPFDKEDDATTEPEETLNEEVIERLDRKKGKRKWEVSGERVWRRRRGCGACPPA